MLHVAMTMRSTVSRLFLQLIMQRSQAELLRAADSESRSSISSATLESRSMPMARVGAQKPPRAASSPITNKSPRIRRRLNHPVAVRMLGQSTTQVRIIH